MKGNETKLAAEKSAGLIGVIAAGIVLGCLIGIIYAFTLLALNGPDLSRLFPYCIFPLTRALNRGALITVLFFIFLWMCGGLLSKYRGALAEKILSIPNAFIISVAIAYLLFAFLGILGRLFSAILPSNLVRMLRLPIIAVPIAFLFIFFFLYRKLVRGGLQRLLSKLTGLSSSPFLKWLCVAVLILMIGLNISEKKLREKMPNIILITLDTLRQDHLGYAGYARETSTNMEKLGEDGVTFLQATSFSDWTLPSHDNLLTGRYPVSTVIKRIPPSSELLPEILKRYGYRTAAFVSGEWCKRQFGLNQGFDYFDDHFPGGQRSIGEYSGSIDNWLATKARPPFFLWLHLFEPHFPYEQHDEYVYEPAQQTEFDKYNKDFTNPEEMFHLWQNKVGLNEKDIERALALYDSEISYLDDYLGRLWDSLKERGLFDNSMIVVTSDHGEGFGEQGMYFYHAYDITEEITRVPLIIKMPDGSKGGAVIEKQVQSSDVFATILDLLGIPFQENILSRSLLPLIYGNEKFEREYAYSYCSKAQTFSVRDGRYKLIYTAEKGDYALYDLEDEPPEKTGIGNKEPEVFRRMKNELNTFKHAFRLFASKHRGKKPAEIDEATKKKLQALGYIN